MKNKKLFSIFIFILGIMMVITGCGSSNTTQSSKTSTNGKLKPITVRIGSDTSTLSLAFQVAKANGYFTKYGIDAQIDTFSSGIDTLNAALTNQVDVGVASDFAALSRLSTGKLKIISFEQSSNAKDNKFVTIDGINKVNDINGKAVGVLKGTASEYVTNLYLNKHKINEKDITIDKFSSYAEMIAALEKGDIKAGFFNGANLVKALDVKGAKAIGSLAEIPFSTRNFILVTKNLVDTNPEAPKRILQALNEATIWINKNPTKAAALESSILKLPEDSFLKTLKAQTNDIRLNDADVQQLQNVYKYAISTKMFPGGDFNVKNSILTQPLKNAFPSKLTYKPADVK